MTAGDGFKDHFSERSADYATYRPTYPRALFDFLAAQCARRDVAWDCATGTGQSALQLADHFTTVVATDASEAQIAAAGSRPGISYRVAAAEQSGLDDNSVDLIAISQALHWFDLDAFFVEAERVLRAGGILAAWCYGLFSANPRIDAVVRHLYDGIAGDYWPPERVYIEEKYTNIDFPAPLLKVPAFSMRAEWTVADALGYLRTWSACKRYANEFGVDPVTTVEDELRAAWGSASQNVVWPLTVCACRLAD